MTLIDLETPTRHKPGEAPVWRMGRAMAGRRHREFLAIVLALLTVGVLAGSGLPRPGVFPVLHRVGPALSQPKYAIGAQYLFTVDDEARLVTAYSMISGEPVWRLEAPNVQAIRVLSGVLIVAVRATGFVRVDESGATTDTGSGVTEVFALDERTGKRRWTHAGLVADGAEAAPLIVLTDGATLAAYEPATGDRVWSRHFSHPVSTAAVMDGQPRLLVQEYVEAVPGVLESPRQPLSSMDIRTGELTPLGTLGYNSGAVMGLGEPLALISSEISAGRPVVRGGRAGSEPVWQFVADAGVVRQTSWSCDGLLCTSQGNLTTAANPLTGEQVWRADSGWVDHRTMTVDGKVVLVTVRRGADGPRTLLLDPRTGQVVRDLSGWSPLGAYHGRQLMLWTPATSSGTAWLGFADSSAPGGVRPLFPIGPAFRCSTTDEWLYCEIVGSGRNAAALRLDTLDGMLA